MLLRGRPANFNSSLRRWNDTAKDCYRRGCICKDCPLGNIYFKTTTCHMKEAVIELVRRFGLTKDLIKKEKENFLQ